MDAERWREIDDLYHQALGWPPEQRGALLARACDGDDDLRSRVERLLAQSTSTGALLDRSAWQGAAKLADESGLLLPGEKLGPYEINSLIGQGGMGQVYRGVDTRLDRPVAIKLCKESFSAWFEREARAISALNHPHICTLYDIGPNYLVMELVEGETLAQRLERTGPLPPEEVLEIGLQIAQALQAAHGKGVIHRDLKPANVKITPEGRAKVLDFSLAKSIRSEPVSEDIPPSPSVTAGVSIAGQMLGTPAYMSPEQARGERLDTRTDIWAFGCLIYELLTGKRAFVGESNADIVAAIQQREPDWTALRRGTPRRVRDLLRKCLEKDRSCRLQDIHTVCLAIDKVKPRPRFLALALAAASTCLLLVVALAVWFLRGRDANADQNLHQVPLTTYLGSQDWPSFSPDGNEVAFAWDGEKQDNLDIYVKKIGPDPPLRLTHDPAPDRAPAWSPDGTAIAFLRGSGPGKAAVVLMTPLGQRERVLAEVSVGGPNNQFLAWSPDSKWVATSDQPVAQPPGLWLVSVKTGETRRLTTVRPGALQDLNLSFSPDGGALAFTRLVVNNSYDVYLLPLAQDLSPRSEPRLLTRENQVVGLAWAPNGRELILSSGPPGNLSLFRISTSGRPRRTRLTAQGEILNLTVSARSKRLVFSQSRREMDIYRADLSPNGDEALKPMTLIASSRLERYPRYSPDGKKIAFVSLRSGNWQLWVSDAEGRNPVQMTSFEQAEVAYPVWSPDGRRIGFTANPEGAYQAYVIQAEGGQPQKIEALGNNVYGWTWSRNGQWIFPSSTGGIQQIWKVAASGGIPRQITQHGAGGGTCAESPDGTLLFYTRPGGVWSVPLNGGAEHQVFRFDVDQGWVQATSSGIYFITNSTVTKPGDLMFYRFPHGPITKIAGVQTRYGFSVSPDARWLVYTRMTSTGSDLMLAENFR